MSVYGVTRATRGDASEHRIEESRVDGQATHNRAAMAFALVDNDGWHFDSYDEQLWVRMLEPSPEPFPGRSIRIRQTRDLHAEQRRQAEIKGHR